MAIRLVIIDGHTLCRHGLAGIVAGNGIELVGEAATLADAWIQIDILDPDVVLVDVAMPDGDGLVMSTRLRVERPELGIVVMAGAEADELVFRAMEARGSAYVSKSAAPQDFLAAIRSAAVAPGLFAANGLAEAMGRRRAGELLLRPRERQVLHLLMDGLSIAEMARAMHLSHSTAKTYTSRVYEKLGVASRAQALMKALRLGVIRQGALFEDRPLSTAFPSCKGSLI